METIEEIRKIVDKFDEARIAMQKCARVKSAFTPMAPPAPPATAMPPQGPPPGDPGMAPPPGDPNAMPPQGPPPGDPGMPPPPGDPGMAPPPPGDPNAMPPQGPPPPGDPGMAPPPGAPNAMPPQGGGAPIPPELESMLSELAQGMGGMSQAVEAQQANLDTLSDRLLKLEEELSDLHDEKQQQEVREQLKAPAGFEGQDEESAAAAAPGLADVLREAQQPAPTETPDEQQQPGMHPSQAL